MPDYTVSALFFGRTVPRNKIICLNKRYFSRVKYENRSNNFR